MAGFQRRPGVSLERAPHPAVPAASGLLASGGGVIMANAESHYREMTELRVAISDSIEVEQEEPNVAQLRAKAIDQMSVLFAVIEQGNSDSEEWDAINTAALLVRLAASVRAERRRRR
jgi:hypothetical protein